MPENTQQFAQNIAQSLLGDEAAHPAQACPAALRKQA